MSGPDPSTSQGNPSQLHGCGLVWQRFTNGVSGMATTDSLRADGGAADWATTPQDANLGGFHTDFQHSLAEASNLFLQFLISAEPQLGDAAVDLFDCAGDFATADSQATPADAHMIGTSVDGIAVYTRDGVTGRDVWWKDKEGRTIHVFHDDGISQSAPPPPGGWPPQHPTPTPTPGASPTPTTSPSGGQS